MHFPAGRREGKALTPCSLIQRSGATLSHDPARRGKRKKKGGPKLKGGEAKPGVFLEGKKHVKKKRKGRNSACTSGVFPCCFDDRGSLSD